MADFSESSMKYNLYPNQVWQTHNFLKMLFANVRCRITVERDTHLKLIAV